MHIAKPTTHCKSVKGRQTQQPVTLTFRQGTTHTATNGSPYLQGHQLSALASLTDHVLQPLCLAHSPAAHSLQPTTTCLHCSRLPLALLKTAACNAKTPLLKTATCIAQDCQWHCSRLLLLKTATYTAEDCHLHCLRSPQTLLKTATCTAQDCHLHCSSLPPAFKLLMASGLFSSYSTSLLYNNTAKLSQPDLHERKCPVQDTTLDNLEQGWGSLGGDVDDLTQHESQGCAKQCKVVSADVQLL